MTEIATNPVPLAEIGEDSVPLAEAPVLPQAEILAQIDDGDVPLAGLPKTGEAASPAKMMLLLSGMILGMYGVLFRKKEEQEQ